MNNKILLSIEGNIGVGKSTFLNIIKSNFEDCEIVPEPVDLWINILDSDKKNILELFYDNPSRWAFSFQNLVYISRIMKIENMIKNSDKKFIFLDRSLGTDKNVFEKMLYQSNKISDVEHKIYELWSNFYENNIISNNKIIYIYLKCNPEICANRITKRGREEEKDITIDYLQELDKFHDDWLLYSGLENVIVFNCDEEFENNPDKQNEMIKNILNKINLE
jgi:deoxyadenosine/deoxycytidine kinase